MYLLVTINKKELRWGNTIHEPLRQANVISVISNHNSENENKSQISKMQTYRHYAKEQLVGPYMLLEHLPE